MGGSVIVALSYVLLVSGLRIDEWILWLEETKLKIMKMKDIDPSPPMPGEVKTEEINEENA